MRSRRVVIAGLLTVLALSGCTTKQVGGEPDRNRSAAASVGAVDLRVPVELQPVLQTVPSGAPTTPTVSGTVLPDQDGNQLTLEDPMLTVRRLDGGEITFQQNGDNWVLSLDLTEDDGDVFAAWTEAHVGEQLAMVVDGEVISAPQIAGPIPNGNIQITGGSGSFTQDEANDLLNKITGR